MSEWKKGFDSGYICAASYLVNGHGEDGLAKYLLQEGGYSYRKLQRMKLEPYDAKALKNVIRSMKP